MNRLGIFCLYDKDGIVDQYVECLLTDLVKNLKDLIIVVNGYIDCQSLNIIKKYANQVIIRENKGFDAGAYREVIVDVLGREKIKEWDEVILCNDTFYGPFIPFEKIFRIMEEKKLDFWGMDYREGRFLSFVQSYFLVFEKKILLNDDLFLYMKDHINPGTVDISDIYASFEVGLFSYLKNSGYSFGCYSYTENYDVYFNGDRCIEEYGLPILKRKAFSPRYFSREVIIRALFYIQKNFHYDFQHILKDVNRVYGIDLDVKEILNSGCLMKKSIEKRIPNLIVDEDIMLDFIQKYPEIYIYGSGVIAKKIWYLFNENFIKFAGFIVSDDQLIKEKTIYGYPVIHYKNVRSGIGIILGLGHENSKIVFPELKKEDMVLRLWEELE